MAKEIEIEKSKVSWNDFMSTLINITFRTRHSSFQIINEKRWQQTNESEEKTHAPIQRIPNEITQMSLAYHLVYRLLKAFFISFHLLFSLSCSPSIAIVLFCYYFRTCFCHWFDFSQLHSVRFVLNYINFRIWFHCLCYSTLFDSLIPSIIRGHTFCA